MRKTLLRTLMGLLLCAGCTSDPDDPQGWIKKLDDPRDQKEALRNLQRLKKPESLKPLMDLYAKDKDPAVLDVIVGFESNDAIPSLISALSYTKENFDHSVRAAEALGRLKAARAVEPLLKMLEPTLEVKDRANLAKQAAIRALARIKDPQAVPALAKMVEELPDKQDLFLNKVAALALAEMPDPRAIPSLIKGLYISRADGATIFQECRYALVKIGEPAVQPLIEVLRERDPNLNAFAKQLDFKAGVLPFKAAYVLGDLASPKAVPALVAKLKESDKGGTQAEALQALGQIGDTAALDAIREQLKNAKADPKVRQAACDAVLRSFDFKSLGLLTDLARNEKGDANLRVAAAMVLSRIGDKSTAQAFVPYARKSGYAEMTEAAERLETAVICGDDLACWKKKLETGKPVEQEKAAFMLGLYGGKSPAARAAALSTLTAKLETQEPVVRLAVLEGLKRVAEPGKADEVVRKLQALIGKEEKMTKVPAFTNLVNEMRILLAKLQKA